MGCDRWRSQVVGSRENSRANGKPGCGTYCLSLSFVAGLTGRR
ncbi:hypothetical protein PGR6_30890 [Pseudomonas sp. GR 6-02]|nr:hypothetical protein PGR6_30890 [Pseudomonas sp. GR 6-02]